MADEKGSGVSTEKGNVVKMPATLSEFLRANPVDNLKEEGVFVSKRFKDAGLGFTIKAIDGNQFSGYRNRCNSIGRHGKMDFDTKLYNELVVLNHTLVPNFKSKEDIEAAGCRTPEEYLYRSLLSGEIEELAKRITALSGFDDDTDALREEAKN